MLRNIGRDPMPQMSRNPWATFFAVMRWRLACKPHCGQNRPTNDVPQLAHVCCSSVITVCIVGCCCRLSSCRHHSLILFSTITPMLAVVLLVFLMIVYDYGRSTHRDLAAKLPFYVEIWTFKVLFFLFIPLFSTFPHIFICNWRWWHTSWPSMM